MSNELALNSKTIVSELKKLEPQIAAALPRHMDPARMARLALTCLRNEPKLFQCSPQSFFGSLIAASQLGLEPGVNGQCYLIPFKGTCTLVPGWKGYMDLVSRSGRASAWTGAVRKDDVFEFNLGSSPRLIHEPADDDTSKFTHVYAVGWVKDAQWPILEVMSRAKVDAHLKRYNKVGDRHYALQGENNFEMYARKIVLLQVVKYLPQSIELARASALDVTASEGRQALTIDMSLNNDLDDGGQGDAEKLAEAARLMEQLGWEQKKREACLTHYEGRVDEMVEYLQNEARKAGRGTAAAQHVSEAPAAATGGRKARGGAKAQPEHAAEPEPEPAQTEAEDEPAATGEFNF